jgi:hypothetical protein
VRGCVGTRTCSSSRLDRLQTGLRGYDKGAVWTAINELAQYNDIPCSIQPAVPSND